MSIDVKPGDIYRSQTGRHVRVIRVKHGMPFHVGGKVAGFQQSRATLVEVSPRSYKKKKAARSYDREPFYSVLRDGAMAPGYSFVTNINTDRTQEIEMKTSTSKKTAAKKTSTSTSKKTAAKKETTAKKTAAKKTAAKTKEYSPRPGSYAAVVLDHFRKASSKGKWFTRAELQTKLKQSDWGDDWPCQQTLFALTSYKGMLKKKTIDGDVSYTLA
jgi:hypothetical protein